jgi:hypothetical protein
LRSDYPQGSLKAAENTGTRVDRAPHEKQYAPYDRQPKDMAPAGHQIAGQDLPVDVLSG